MTNDEARKQALEILDRKPDHRYYSEWFGGMYRSRDDRYCFIKAYVELNGKINRCKRNRSV